MRTLLGVLRGKPRYMFSSTNWRLFLILNMPVFFLKALSEKFRSYRGQLLPRDLPDLLVDDSHFPRVQADGRLVISSTESGDLQAGKSMTIDVKGSNIAINFLMHRQLLCRISSLSAIGLYQMVDHPLLRDISHHRGDDRTQIVIDTCLNVNPESALDIGANMGQLSQTLLRQGLPTMSVEMNRLYYRLLSDRLRMYDQSDRFCGSVFDLAHYNYDLVVAFSIFHHFLVTEELYKNFCEFLPKLRCRYMLFEPHQSKHGFSNAYMDFDEDEFCDFICEHSVLKSYERIGESVRRRPIYLLKA